MMNRLLQITSIAVAISLASYALGQGTTLSEFDRTKLAVQKICPVSGNELASVDNPMKVKIGAEEIFLCCKRCAKGKIDAKHWVTIHKNFAAAQGICPVMEKPLPANPKSTNINGQTIYICCPPCTKKIRAEPKKYLTKLAGYYRNATAANKPEAKVGPTGKTAAHLDNLSERDQLKVAVQKICPVSGKPLGRMGTPLKVKVGGMDTFLCCEGCKAGKVNAQHWASVTANVAKAQKFCPVMEKELPSNAKSTIVNGQLVFVCCPPCTKKIAKEPTKFLSKVDSYYVASLSKEKATSGKNRLQ